MLFDKLAHIFQCKFKDRRVAAIALSDLLKDKIKKEDKKSVLVLGIPRGGALTAAIVSTRLSLPNFDIIIPRKLTDPDNKDQAIGATMGNGFNHVLYDLIRDFQISEDYVKREIDLQSLEIHRRKKEYYRNLYYHSISDVIREYNTILVVDDGIASGATMMVAAKWIRQVFHDHNNNLGRLILAAPVGPKDITTQLIKECEAEVEVFFHPSQTDFHSVEQYHHNFEMIADERVVKIMREHGL